MLFFGTVLPFLVCGSNLSQAEVTKIRKESFEYFDEAFFGGGQVEREVSKQFSQQINEALSGKIDQLLQQLPFEPDNLGTSDCTFHACCSVLLLNDLVTNTHDPKTTEKIDLLAKIAVLTYIMHAEQFFERIFVSEIDKYYSEKLKDVEKQLIDTKDKLDLEYKKLSTSDEVQQFFSSKPVLQQQKDIKSLENKKPCLEEQRKNIGQKYLQMWSQTTDDRTAFLDYKLDVASKMVTYVNSKISVPTPIEITKVDNKISIKYPDNMWYESKLVLFVKRETGRLVLMERNFGMLDDGGESGKVRVLKEQRLLPSITNDSFDVYDVHYLRSINKIDQVSSVSAALDSNPTLVLQTARNTQSDFSVKAYFGAQSLGPSSHLVEKRKDWFVEERFENHAVTSSADCVLKRNNWFSGTRGLTMPSGMSVQNKKNGNILTF